MNPILGQNMGRWAEVYFNSPPEKRDQAVLELLLDLEGENSQSEDSLAAARTADRGPIPVLGVIPNPQIEKVSPDMVGCKLCGRKNPPQHKFCGMCGASLDSEAVQSEARIKNTSGAEPARTAESPEDDFIRGRPAFDEQMPTSSELEEFLTAVRSNEDAIPFQTAAQPVPNSYRPYVGAALALLLLFLVYFAWRGTANQDATQDTPPPVPANAPAAPDPSARQPESPNRGTSSDADTGVASHPPTKAMNETAGAEPTPSKPTQAVPHSAGPAENAVPTEAVSADGSAELAVAQSYLRDTRGQQRNTEEAVKWLWKAIAKRNAAATLQLSDLYLRGDGVPKNCDQARVLLDAAASKGTKGAAERLRHLQAFGCQ
ncbi:MAG TPA: hypothetical protein VFE61_19785 [Candidatus Sulfotelmatobacter sp.]|nr:hypothetical protein [Candidatus Sulfotelmatobacter sp.]